MLKQIALQRVKMFYRWDSFDEWKESQINFAPEWLELAEELKQEGNMVSYKEAMSSWRKCINPQRRDWLKVRRRRIDTIRKLKAKSISKSELIRVIRKIDTFSFICNPFLERKGWYCDIVPGYGDNFRIHDYDAEPWFCYEDFCKYLEEHPEREVYISDCDKSECIKVAKEIVKGFFEKHPNGYITLG